MLKNSDFIPDYYLQFIGDIYALNKLTNSSLKAHDYDDYNDHNT